jgi:hypothetical protein
MLHPLGRRPVWFWVFVIFPVCVALVRAQSPAGGFRPTRDEHAGLMFGNAETASGVWLLRVPEGDARAYVAADEPVVTESDSDSILFGFSLEEVCALRSADRVPRSVECLLEVSQRDLAAGRQFVSAPVRVSLANEGKVFAVWLTVGRFEITREGRMGSFAIVDRSLLTRFPTLPPPG